MPFDITWLQMLIARFNAKDNEPVAEERKREFEREQQCSIGFAGLRPIWRMFRS